MIPYVPMPVMPPEMLPPPQTLPMPGPHVGADLGGALFGPPCPLPGMGYTPPMSVPTTPQAVAPGLMQVTPVVPSAVNQVPACVSSWGSSNVATPVTAQPGMHDDQPR